MLFEPKENAKVTVCLEGEHEGKEGKIISISNFKGFRGYRFSSYEVLLDDGTKGVFKSWEIFS